jgi:hypothetical protein
MSKSRQPAVKPPPDIAELEMDIDEFIENARAQYYFAPNRIVAKKDRPKWRFLVKQYYRDLVAVANLEENLSSAASMLERLYSLLCYACGYYTFNTTNPFHSIGIPQTEFFRQVLTLKKRCEESRIFFTGSLKLVVENDVDGITIHRFLIDVILDFLTTPDLCETAIAICGETIEDYQKIKIKANDSMQQYKQQSKIEELAVVGFLCQAKLHNFEAAIAFFQQYYHRKDPEAALFVLLELLQEFDQKELFIREYSRACNEGITPRSGLQQIYEKITQMGQ